MNLGLANSVVLVTGASRGLGRAAAEAFAAEGARLAICSHSPEIQTAADAVHETYGTEVIGVQADLTSPADIDRFVATALDRYGRIDVAVVNVGGPKPGEFLELTPDDWLAAVDLVLMSTVRVCYSVLPHMLEQGSGSIVASQSYSVKQAIDRLILSNSIRMAVVGMVKSLAGELGPRGIRVNSIHPGWTTTERVVHLFEDRAARSGATPEAEAEKIVDSIPLRRMARPEEIGRAIAWLASPAASFVHGHALLVDGGIVKAAL
jgi:3-oxoacyl-[acyl-carrier protein] reductase